MIADVFARHHASLEDLVQRATKVSDRDYKRWQTDEANALARGVKSEGAFRVTDLAALRLLLEQNCIVEAWRASPVRLTAFPPSEPIDISALPLGSFLIELPFELVSDLLCKDDAQLHLLDNPVKKDKVTGYPEYWGPSWKGILRNAYRTRFGDESLELRDEFRIAQDTRLFGSAKGTKENLRSGRLRFFTTRFDKIGFIVLHPTPRAPGKSDPILYECVPPGTVGRFQLLYCPWDKLDSPQAEITQDAEDLAAALVRMFRLGIGAKSSAGFGEVTLQPAAITSRRLGPDFDQSLRENLAAADE